MRITALHLYFMCVLVPGLFCAVLLPAQASDFGRTTQLAITGDPSPDGNGYLDFIGSGGVFLNDAGQVAFRAKLDGTPYGGVDEGLFRATENALELIVRRGHAAPDGDGVVYDLSPSSGGHGGTSIWPSSPNEYPALNAAGQLTVLAMLENTSGPADYEFRLYRSGGGALTELYRPGQPAPDGNGSFDSIGRPFFDASGQAIFFAGISGTNGGFGDDQAIVRSADGVLTQIVREGQAAPDGNGNFYELDTFQLNTAGQVAFWAELTGTAGGESDDYGLFIADNGTIMQIVRQDQAIPVGYGRFKSFTGQMNALGQVAFAASIDATGVWWNQEGLFLAAGGAITELFRAHDWVPDGSGRRFTKFRVSSFNAAGQIGFHADMKSTPGGPSDSEALYRLDGTELVELAYEYQPAPNGYGCFIYPGSPLLNEAGVALISTRLSGTSDCTIDFSVFDYATYLADGEELIQVVRVGNPLSGSTIQQRSFWGGNASEYNGFNENGQVAYLAGLEDGRVGAFLFTPYLHYRRSVDGLWVNADNWTVGLAPAAVHDVFIDPAVSLTVTAPAGLASAHSLTVGGGAGGATLLLNGGMLAVTNGLHVQTSGTLTGTGAVEGDVMLAPGSTTELSIAGVGAHDAIEVSAQLTLGGTLDVTLAEGFVPAPGQPFDLLRADSITATFDVVNLPDISPQDWAFAVLADEHGTDDVFRVAVAEPLTLTTTYAPEIGINNQFYWWGGLDAAGGQPPYTYSIIDGFLHYGTSLRADDGVIMGVPSDGPYTANFTVQVMDANANTATLQLQQRVTQPSGGCSGCHQ